MKFFLVITGSNSKQIKRKNEGKVKEKYAENDNAHKNFKHVRENSKTMVGLRKTKMWLGKWKGLRRVILMKLSPRKTRLIRLNRQVSFPKKKLLHVFTQATIGTSKFVHLMKAHARGFCKDGNKPDNFFRLRIIKLKYVRNSIFDI